MNKQTEYTLHKIKEGFIVCSDEEIKEDDIKYTPLDDVLKIHKQEGQYYDTHEFKVIAQQDQIIFSALKEEEQKEIGWFDVLELGNADYIKGCNGDLELNDYLCGYSDGFQKRQELLSDRKFTYDDMMDIAGFMAAADNKRPIPHLKEEAEEYIKRKKSQQSWKVELLMEDDQPNRTPNGKVTILKLL
jgi:hypothetical protein